MQRRIRAVWKLGLLISVCCWVSGFLYAAPGTGRFDLNQWNRSSPLNLDGHWLYMPGRFVEPQDFEDILDHDNQDIKVLQAGGSLPEEAEASRYGTYILRLAHPQKFEELALLHGLYYSSAKSQVFCRNLPSRSLTLHLGQVGASLTSSTPKLSTFAVQDLQELRSVPLCTELVMMLQVSSFHHSWAGMWHPPRLGRTADFEALRSQQKHSYLFLFGILLCVCFYAGSFAWRCRAERGASFVALGALLLALRMACLCRGAVMDEGSTPWLWHFENLVISVLGYGVPYLALKSLKHFHEVAHLSHRTERALDALVLVLILFQLLTPVRFWTTYAGLFPLFGLVSMLLVLRYLAQALRQRLPHVWPLFLGAVLAFSGMLMELLVMYRFIDYRPLNFSGYGIAIWLTLQLQRSAQSFADAAEKSESLSLQLQDDVQ